MFRAAVSKIEKREDLGWKSWTSCNLSLPPSPDYFLDVFVVCPQEGAFFFFPISAWSLSRSSRYLKTWAFLSLSFQHFCKDTLTQLMFLVDLVCTAWVNSCIGQKMVRHFEFLQALFTADILTCHCRKSTGFTNYVFIVLVSHVSRWAMLKSTIA